MERYAKAITVLAVGLVGYLLAKAGVEAPLDQVEVIIGELVTAFFVFLVPNNG